jgi:hypothetical protein
MLEIKAFLMESEKCMLPNPDKNLKQARGKSLFGLLFERSCGGGANWSAVKKL